MIKKADILLFVCLLLFGIAVSWLSLSGSITGENVRVRCNDFFFLQESGLRADRRHFAD